jgi:hypothetical protein
VWAGGLHEGGARTFIRPDSPKEKSPQNAPHKAREAYSKKNPKNFGQLLGSFKNNH